MNELAEHGMYLSDPVLESISINTLVSHLERTGWRRVTHSNDRIFLFQGPLDDGGKPLQLIIPRDHHFEDANSRLAEALKLLAVVHREPLEYVIDRVMADDLGEARWRRRFLPGAQDRVSDPVASLGGAAAKREVQPSPTEAVEKFFDLVLDELGELRTRAEVEAIERAADLILDCESRGGRVHVTGIGKSEHVARYIASLLSSTGTPAYFLHATECVHGSAGQVRVPDVAIAVSNSGTTPELIRAVDVLRGLGIKIIGVSGNRDSSLARGAAVLLHTGVDNEGGVLNLVPRASILAKVYVLCALSVALEAHKGLTREQYARWHPGGALGQVARGDELDRPSTEPEDLGAGRSFGALDGSEAQMK